VSRSAPGPISTRLPAAVDAWVRAQPGSPAEVMRQLAIRAMQAANGQLPDATQPELEADTSPSAASLGGGSVSPGGSPARSADPAPAPVPEVATRAELLALAAQVARLAAAVRRGASAATNPPPARRPVAVVTGPRPTPLVDPRAPSPEPSTVERWLAEGWPAQTARGLLRALDDKLSLSDSELVDMLDRWGVSGAVFDAHLEEVLSEWMTARGDAPPTDAASSSAARAALAAELRAALEAHLPAPTPG